MKYLLPLITALMLLSACHIPPPPATETETLWSLQYDISGGIAGLQRSLHLDNSGSLIALDRKANYRFERLLNPAELSEIEAMLHALPQPPTNNNNSRPSPIAGYCADCIESQLQVKLDGLLYNHTTHSGAADSTYDALHRHLSALLRQSLER